MSKGRFPEQRSSPACRHPAPLALVSPAFGTGRRAWRRGAAALVAGIIDRIEGRPYRTGRPPLPTIEVVETLRFLVREGVQWRGARGPGRRAPGAPPRPPPRARSAPPPPPAGPGSPGRAG